MNYTKKEELRKVEFINIIDCEGKGYFHFWFEKDMIQYAMIETVNGTMKNIPAENIRFVDYFSGSQSAKILEKLKKFGSREV